MFLVGLFSILKPLGLKNVLSSKGIMNNITFIAFIVLLGIVYIWNGSFAEKNKRMLMRENTTNEALSWDLISAKQEYMQQTRHNRAVKEGQKKGYGVSVKPPIVFAD